METTKEGSPLLTNEDIGSNMDAYEASLEKNTSHDVTMRLNMTTAYGAGVRIVRDLYETDRQKSLSRIAELEARLSLYEQQVVEPFNDHTSLPWSQMSAQDVHGEVWSGYNHIVADCWACATHTTDNDLTQANAEFIAHACNSHYPLLRRTAALTKALGVAEGAGNAMRTMMGKYREILGFTTCITEWNAALSTIKQLDNTDPR